MIMARIILLNRGAQTKNYRSIFYGILLFAIFNRGILPGRFSYLLQRILS